MYIFGRHPVEIAENCEGFVASTKRKFLYFKKLPGLRFQRINNNTSYNYSYLTVEILSDEFGLTRDDVYICMRKEGIIVRKHFFPKCSNYPCYKALPSAKIEMLPHANQQASRFLCLPLYDEMKEEDVDKVVEVLSLLHKHAREIKKLVLPSI